MIVLYYIGLLDLEMTDLRYILLYTYVNTDTHTHTYIYVCIYYMLVLALITKLYLLH